MAADLELSNFDLESGKVPKARFPTYNDTFSGGWEKLSDWERNGLSLGIRERSSGDCGNHEEGLSLRFRK
ncbi:hypothetical protein TNCT_521321 [Trichonephila clavata]|uniref:Uncharacterized protein n=1 Tax=Trichonephila clavata TaxID=2740835 RepID=A0A8X6F0Q2_TRICU|nr:hypothetical protein TNCT_521321 [Trichonephila clavata]